ncbi:MAG TPA: AAA family ATPase [Rectinemataceae bacterium]|nr:AAA family ATPase [Rectinemataceae bacterium]
MIQRLFLENFGPIGKLDWKGLGKINLIIGNNGTGKTFLLKAAYSATKSLEEFKRGAEPRKLEDILATKLYWTFQTERLGELVKKGDQNKLSFRMEYEEGILGYAFGESTKDTIVDLSGPERGLETNSLFLPAKEVLTLYKPIISSREVEKSFGFDDTYYDLAKVLSIHTTKGRNYPEFADARRRLESLIGGKVEYQDEKDRWVYRKNLERYSFPIASASEGIKKVAILDAMLGNRYLVPGSIIFIDEPESALHPEAIAQFMDIVFLLAGSGLQFFLASHSYFVIKCLAIIAQKSTCSIPVLSFTEDGSMLSDLQNGFPDNPIVAESVRLYQEEVGLAFE